jgi:hypothetical protein
MPEHLKYDDKIKLVIDYLKTNNGPKTAKKFGTTSPTVYRWAESLKNNDQIVKFRKSLEKNRKKEVEVFVEKEIEQDDELIKTIKTESREINILVVKRMKEIIPGEKNLERLLKAYGITANILLPTGQDPEEEFKKVGGVFNQLNVITKKMIIGNAKSED